MSRSFETFLYASFMKNEANTRSISKYWLVDKTPQNVICKAPLLLKTVSLLFSHRHWQLRKPVAESTIKTSIVFKIIWAEFSRMTKIKTFTAIKKTCKAYSYA